MLNVLTGKLDSSDDVAGLRNPTTGIAVLDFGTTPYFEASAAVTGQTKITSASKVTAWISGTSSATNTNNDHMQAGAMLKVTSGSITPGVGFSIAAHTIGGLLTGQINVNWEYI